MWLHVGVRVKGIREKTGSCYLNRGSGFKALGFRGSITIPPLFQTVPTFGYLYSMGQGRKTVAYLKARNLSYCGFLWF